MSADQNKTISPLFQSISRISASKDRALIVFYSTIFFVFALIALLPFSTTVQKIMMSKFHLTLRPFALWAAAQPVPSMYNFENRIYWSFEPVYEMSVDTAHTDGFLSVNHYPLRMLFYTTSRQNVVLNRPMYVYLRSLYQDYERVTSYLISSTSMNIHAQLLGTYERSRR